MPIHDQKIHGIKYFTAGRYDYTAIDYTTGDCSGTGTAMSGIKPKKLAEQILNKIKFAQSEAYLEMAMVSLVGESAHSESLYLFAVNTREIYDRYLKPLTDSFRAFMKEYAPDCKLDRLSDHGLQNLRSCFYTAIQAFNEASEMYRKEFPVEGYDSRNFTGLDFYTCAADYIRHLFNEYKINGLE